MDRFICAFVLSLVSTASLGSQIIDLGPSDYKNFGPSGAHTPAGVRSSFGQTVRMPPTTLNVSRNPIVPYGSLGNGLKNLARSTPGAILASGAISALFYAVDWIFDQGTGQWSKAEPEYADDPSISLWRLSVSGQVYWGPSPDAVCPSLLNHLPAGYTFTHVTFLSSTNAQCQGTNQSGAPATLGGVSRSGNCPEGSTLDPAVGKCVIGTMLVPLTDSDFSELTSQLPSLPVSDVSGAAGDVQRQLGNPLPGYSDTDITGPSSFTGPSTSTTTTGPDGNVTTTTTNTTNIDYGPTTITTSNTSTTNTYTNGEHTGTSTTTETPSPDVITSPGETTTSLDIPTDCEFMPTVCAFLDWFKEPIPMPEPDLPVVVDHDFEREYEMNLTAECPPPYTVDTQLFGTLSISWAPFCDLAGLMKPLVVGSAFLMSAFITLGIGRGRA